MVPGFLKRIYDHILPPVCAGCGADVQSGGSFCVECFVSSQSLARLSCRRCGVPFASEDYAGPEKICVSCKARPPAWSEAQAAFVYDDWSRRLILPMKYADRTENVRVLAHFMARAGAPLIEKADLIVPVPMHWMRLWSRRYNQAALLAMRLARTGKRRYVGHALSRTRATRALARLTPKERTAQIADAFTVRSGMRSAVAGKAVLLVDDVLTTGVTATFCTAALLEAGATSVSVLVAARAVSPKDDAPTCFKE